jgi:hypothetical protein
MGIIGRVVGLAFIGMAGTMAVGAAAALNARQRIVPTTDPAADDITVASIFGPLAYTSTSKHFTGGTVECWYGGGALDLRDAVLAPGGATLRLKAVFGGGQILVPPTWPVVTHVTGVGGIQDSRPAAGKAEGAPTLTIEGTVVFGGFQVLSEMPAGQEDWFRDVEAAKAEAAGAKPDATATATLSAETPKPTNGAAPEMSTAG